MKTLSELWEETKTALSFKNKDSGAIEVQQAKEKSEQLADRPLAEPPVDVYENKKELLIVADVPGSRPKDALVSASDGNTLVLYASTAKGDQRSTRLEGERFADWYRSFVIPDAFNAEKSRAKLDKGVMEIRIPRKKESAPKLIPVRAHG